MPYVKPAIARKHFGVTDFTLRNWGDNGKIHFIRDKSSNMSVRLYDLDSYVGNKDDPAARDRNEQKKEKVIYCRVSSNKQKEDLKRQIDFLQTKYPEHVVYSDIASGINFERKALTKLLDKCLAGLVEEVVVAHRDRLCRIAWKHFEFLFKRLRISLVVDGEQDFCPETELRDDLLSIIHVFSCRHYGSRRRYTKTGITENEVEVSLDKREQALCEDEEESSCFGGGEENIVC
jgi:predicted site-specific integrase-resolvase